MKYRYYSNWPSSGTMEFEAADDDAAFEHTNGVSDGPSPMIEKLFEGQWRLWSIEKQEWIGGPHANGGYRKEFPSTYTVPPSIDEAVNSGRLIDISWGNDASPSFTSAKYGKALDDGDDEKIPRLWVDYPEKDGREFPECGRLRVVNVGPGYETMFESEKDEDVELAIRALEAIG